MKLELFFAQYPVFTGKEFFSFLTQGSSYKHGSAKALLVYHEKMNHILRIRRGLYAVIPILQRQQKSFQVNPYLIAGRVTEDSILGYHTALDLQGFAYSAFNHFYYFTRRQVRPLEFQSNTFCAVSFPKPLVLSKKENFAVTTVNRDGLDIRVTSIERTLVDCLSHPAYSGAWDEIWSSFSMVPVLNLDIVVEYALLLDNATVTAKVGFFLEQHREQFNVTENYLKSLEAKIPSNKHYLERSKRMTGKLVKRWNLIVPETVLTKKWEEPNEIL